MTAGRTPGRARSAVSCLCILVALSGCAGGGCKKPGAYASSTNGAPLRVPPDLSKPPEDQSFEVPPRPPGADRSPPCGHYPPKLAEAAAREAPPPARPASAAPAQPLPSAVPAPANPEPAPPPQIDPAVEEELRQLLTGWADSWNAGDFERYLSYYAATFQPPGGLTVEEWRTARRSRQEKHPSMTVMPDTLSVEHASADHVTVQFDQRSELDGVQSSLRKGLVLVREGDAWRIEKELVVAVLSGPR